MLEDDLFMYDKLLNMVEHFENQSAFNYFRSTEARESNSKARALL